MRRILLLSGLVCWWFGGQIMVVDKIILHDYVLQLMDIPAHRTGPPSQLVVDLPDSWGYFSLALGTAFVMYSIALRRKRLNR